LFFSSSEPSSSYIFFCLLKGVLPSWKPAGYVTLQGYGGEGNPALREIKLSFRYYRKISLNGCCSIADAFKSSLIIVFDPIDDEFIGEFILRAPKP
jgi:hypothetical protein